MMVVIGLGVALWLVLLTCLTAVYLMSPSAFLILVVVLALTPAACAWCFDYLDRKRAAAGPLRVIDQGEP